MSWLGNAQTISIISLHTLHTYIQNKVFFCELIIFSKRIRGQLVFATQQRLLIQG